MEFASLKMIEKGKKAEPPRIILYGVHGIGKSSWAASAPAPIFIQTERGLKEIETDKFPLAESFLQVLDFIEVLHDEKHDYKTLIVDSLDWLEKLIFVEVAKAKGVSSIEEIGFQAGYKIALKYWDEILAKLDDLQEKKKMAIIGIAHSQIKNFNSPESEPYDRYQLDLHKHAAARVQQWADAVLFLNYKTYTSKLKVGAGKEVIKAMGTGERVIYTEEKPAYQAKNRYDFPSEIPFLKNQGWSEFKKHFKPAKKLSVKLAKEEFQQEQLTTVAEIESVRIED